MPKLRNCTLLYLIKRTDGEVSDICLAMKKRGFGSGRWNGAGGKVEAGESSEDAARRETREEIGVSVKSAYKVGELTFRFPHNPAWDHFVHAYISEEWEGELAESDEMRPQWFKVEDIPWSGMWPDDKFWLPEMFRGNRIRASFVFGKGDVVLNILIEMVENF